LNIIISNSSGVPIYEQIKEQIKGSILNGELEEHGALPSIRALAQELRISVITTKRAYEDLERDGFIYTLPGKGSFIAAQNKELVKEAQMRIIEEKFTEAIEVSKYINLSLEDLMEILKVLFEEQN
jgi:GntR family transcriptional regulator